MEKMTLFASTVPSRSARPVWLLHEMGMVDAVNIHYVDFFKGQHKSPEFLKVNPLGQVPALSDGDFQLSESIAIMHYILKKLYQEGRFVPYDNTQRAIYDTCLCLTANDMDNSVIRAFAMTQFSPPENHNKGLLEYWKDIFTNQCVPVLTQFLTDSEFLCGPQFTVADIVVGFTLNAANVLGWLKPGTPVYSYWLRLAHRPAFQKAMMTEGKQLPAAPPAPQTKQRLYKLSSKPILYTNPNTRGQRIVWLINECGLSGSVEIKNIDLTKGEHKSPDYLKIHPGGVLPCLTDGDFTLTESGAILSYILRRFNKWGEFASYDPKGMGVWEKILFFTLGSIDGSILEAAKHYFLSKILKIIPFDGTKLEYFKGGWNSAAPIMDKILGESVYSTGDKFQAVDCLLGQSLSLAVQSFPDWCRDYPNILDYVERLKKRKGYQLTWPKPKPTLFHDPISRSSRVTWLIEEANLNDEVDIKEVKLLQGEHKKPEFLKVNPAGLIPALIESDGYTLSESVAICQYLLEKYGKADQWIPTDLKERGLHHKFIMLTIGTADPLTFDSFVHILFTPPDKYDYDFKKK